MKRLTKCLLCGLMLGTMTLSPLVPALPAVVRTVSAASAATSGTIRDVRWSFDRETGTLIFESIESEHHVTGVLIYKGKAYIDHPTSGGSMPNEEYFTEEWLAPWESYRDEIRHIKLDQDVRLPDEEGYFQHLASETIECKVNYIDLGSWEDGNIVYETVPVDDYGWTYDVPSDTLTYYGSGPHSYAHHAEGETGGSYTEGFCHAFSSSDSFLQPESVVLSDGMTEAYAFPECDRLVLGSSAELGGNWEVRKEFAVDPDNPYYTTYDGALFSKDGKELIAVPTEMTYIPAHPDLEVLKTGCFSSTHFSSPIVIPWGVTTIESLSLLNCTSDAEETVYIFPDTIETVLDDGSNRSTSTRRVYSVYNSPVAETVRYEISDWGAVASFQAVDSVLSYYGITPGSWVERGDRRWYIDETGKMAKGAVTIDGTEYFFDDHGLLDTDEVTPEDYDSGFRTIDGKTYYFRDGEQIKGRWAYIDGKIYLFDQDGVMQKSGWYYFYRRDARRDYGGCYVYLNDYGAGAVKCWRYWDGHYKELDAEGKITERFDDFRTGQKYLGTDGIAVSYDWVVDYGKRYYLDGWGIRCEPGWQEIDGKWYYFTDSGAVAENTWIDKDGLQVYVGPDGAME